MKYHLAVEKWRQGQTKDLLNKFFPKFIYTSDKIIGASIIFEEVQNSFKYYITNNQFPINNRLTASIKNHIKLCENIFKIIEDNESKLSVELIKYLHDELIVDCFTEELSAIREQMEQKLLVLIKEINQSEINSDNDLNVVSYLCCKFQSIVPFNYDNGVILRVLVNYLLIANNFPPVVFWYDDIEAYNKALEHFDSFNEIDKMVSFFQDEAYKTWLKDYNVKEKKLKDFL